MLEFLTTHLDTIIAFVSGGGLLTVITARATKKQAEAQAMKAVQEVYQETIKDLRSDKDAMRDENLEMREELAKLRKTVNDITRDLRALKRDRCVVQNCQHRKKE